MGLPRKAAYRVRRCAAADHVLPFFGKEKPQNAIIVLWVCRWAYDYIHRLPCTHFAYERGNIVIRRIQAERKRSVHQHGCKVLRRKFGRIPAFQAFDYVLAGPAILHYLANACVGNASVISTIRSFSCRRRVLS